MKSPIPPHARLVHVPTDCGLVVLSDPETGGCWIDAGRYWEWVRRQPGFPRALPEGGGEPREVSDSDVPLLSPKSGRLMRKFEVGFGQGFRIDFDASSGGFWLDAGEWEALRASGLHDALHLICSEDYQKKLRTQERSASRDRRAAGLLGAEQKARLDEVAAWLGGLEHPGFAMAYLIERVEAAGRDG